VGAGRGHISHAGRHRRIRARPGSTRPVDLETSSASRPPRSAIAPVVVKSRFLPCGARYSSIHSTTARTQIAQSTNGSPYDGSGRRWRRRCRQRIVETRRLSASVKNRMAEKVLKCYHSDTRAHRKRRKNTPNIMKVSPLRLTSREQDAATRRSPEGQKIAARVESR
jgi:hypothetical protein